MFFNIWFGMVYSTPIGFLIGSICHKTSVKDGLRKNKLQIITFGAMSFILGLFGFVASLIFSKHLDLFIRQ